MTAPAPVADPAAPPSSRALETAAQLAALLYTYQQASQAIRAQVEGFVTAVWRSLGYYGNAQIPAFLQQVLPFIAGAQQQMATLTAAHLAHQATVAVRVPFQPVAIDPVTVSGAALRNGTPPAEVYGRPFHLVWRQLAELPHEPGSIDQAVQAGLDRAVQTALTDVQLAKTHASQQVLEQDRYAIGWRRVLEGAHSCGLCIVASTNTYHKRQLAAIHPGCDCSVAAVYVDSDAAERANRRLLGDVHQAIAARFGASDYAARAIPGAKDGAGNPIHYRDVLVTHEHGELGPVLAVKGRPFTGPADVGRPKRKRPAAKPGRTPDQVRAELAALQRHLPTLVEADKPRAWIEARIAALQRQLDGGA